MNLTQFRAPVSRFDALTAILHTEGERTAFYLTCPSTGLALFGNSYLLADVSQCEIPRFAAESNQSGVMEVDGTTVMWRGTLARRDVPHVVRLWDQVMAAQNGVSVVWSGEGYIVDDVGTEIDCDALYTLDGKRECLVQARFLRAIVRDTSELARYGEMDMQDVHSPLRAVLRIRYDGTLLACVRGLCHVDKGAVFAVFSDVDQEGGVPA